jgi:hypothetical protein
MGKAECPAGTGYNNANKDGFIGPITMSAIEAGAQMKRVQLKEIRADVVYLSQGVKGRQGCFEIWEIGALKVTSSPRFQSPKFPSTPTKSRMN